ncbi:MAG: sugar ABC transporter permease [Anaerolineae bacterium]|nr:sugar ABC transporter permease [Anaerolineae bacterium]
MQVAPDTHGKPKRPKQKNITLEERIRGWTDASNVLLMPAILIILFLSVFPLIVSLFASFARIRFVPGGFEINYVGLANFKKIFFGSEQRRFLGRIEDPTIFGWVLFFAFLAFMLVMLLNHIRSERANPFSTMMRVITIIIATALAYLAVATLTPESGLPGTLVVTLIFVFIGVTLQYLLGLGLAMMLTQNLPGKRIFRVMFLLPMMITPVGIGFLFRMIVDTQKGPFADIWYNIGLANFSFVATPWGARTAIIIGDTWQWTPFMFIILLAALEGIPREIFEAAMVDGANRLSMFRHIIMPQVIPVSTTVILIRLIESFKIIDLPNVLTYGGPGTATESVSLHAYSLWRALDLGTSAALAYALLFVVTFIALAFVNIIRRRLLELI